MVAISPCCNMIALAGMACSFLYQWKYGLLGLGIFLFKEFLAFRIAEDEILLNSLPNCHWSVPYSSAWILYIRYTNRENKTLHAAHQKYGSLIRVGPREVSTNVIDGGIKVVYGGGLEKGSWYSFFENFGSAISPLSITTSYLSEIATK